MYDVPIFTFPLRAKLPPGFLKENDFYVLVS